ncbi:MAG TPA: glycosyltransferase [Roseiflexaceae bacterium]|jgi:UDP-N-acetylglucosamine:LPS N-acetylglucosamine transferase|nr:glycosyltransferase [Roseiflexaceae bacterium]
MADTPRILYAISDTGGGHRSGATAIDAAVEHMVGASVERQIVDILAITGTPFIRDAPDLYDQLSTRWLPIYDFLYRATDGRRRIEMLTELVYLQAHRNVLQVLKEVRPNLVVSTHPLSTRLIAYARRSYRLPFRFMSVVTDLVSLHAAHAERAVDLCVVPTDEAYQRQRAGGMQVGKLVRTGFPVHPKFPAYTGSQSQARATLTVQPAPFTVLVTSGGVGSGNLRTIVLALAQTYPQLQFLVVTGKNAPLRQALQELHLPNVHVFGFVNNMEVLMAASDLIVTKAGPGTLMEALVMRRPVIVTEAVGMQEQGNIDYVLNHEIGLFCPTVERMIPAVAEFLQPEIYAATVQRLKQEVTRDGAAEIAQIVQEQLKLAPPMLRRRWLPTMGNLRRPQGRAFRRRAAAVGSRLRTSARRLRKPHTRHSLLRRQRHAKPNKAER